MTSLEREFYRSGRGPTPNDEDVWRLVFDASAMRLFVCHEWEATGHSGVDEFTVDEILAQRSAASEALIALLFNRVAVVG
jgi:hypothetical protein